MQENSYLSRLFPVSKNYGTPQAVNGLQSISEIKKELQDRFGKDALTPDAATGTSPLQSTVQSAQARLSQLKDKIDAAVGGSSDMMLPGFTPSGTAHKNFFRRLRYGFNFQSESSTSVLPVASDLGMGIAYMVSKKMDIGLGASFKNRLG